MSNLKVSLDNIYLSKLSTDLIDYEIINYFESKSNPVYRYFSKKEYAESFSKGFVRVSTLNACRKLENVFGRDENEGRVHKYISELHIDDGRDDKYDIFYGQIGNIIPRKIKNLSIIETRIGTYKLDDAHVLCLSNSKSSYLKENFGKYVVRVDRPILFAYLIFNALKFIENIFMFKTGKVIYGNQNIDITKYDAADKIGFLKNYEFEKENEFRMLFYNHNPSIKPMTLNIPYLKNICTLLE